MVYRSIGPVGGPDIHHGRWHEGWARRWSVFVVPYASCPLLKKHSPTKVRGRQANRPVHKVMERICPTSHVHNS